MGAFYALSDEERDYQIAAWDLDRGNCPQCHGPVEECSDPERDWYAKRTVCYLTMVREAARARYERLHEDAPWHDGSFESWSPKPSREHPYHRDMGVNIWVAPEDLAPDDDFLKLGGSESVDEQPAPEQP